MAIEGLKTKADVERFVRAVGEGLWGNRTGSVDRRVQSLEAAKKAGTAEAEWDGAGNASGDVTVDHGLKSTPGDVQLTVLDESGALLAWAVLKKKTTTQLVFCAVYVEAPPKGSKVKIEWRAEA